MPRRKITRTEMKEDKFVASVFKGAQYARENTRNMVILVAVLAVIIIGVFGVRYYLSSQTEAAETKLGIAQIAYQAGEYQECRDSLLVVANKYSSSKPARVAEFLLGHMYYAFGMPDTAKIYWDKFIHPATTPKYHSLGFETWWVDKEKEAKLKAKKASLKSN